MSLLWTNIYLFLVHVLRKVASKTCGGAASESLQTKVSQVVYTESCLHSWVRLENLARKDKTTFVCSPSMLTLLFDRRVSKIGLMLFFFLFCIFPWQLMKPSFPLTKQRLQGMANSLWWFWRVLNQITSDNILFSMHTSACFLANGEPSLLSFSMIPSTLVASNSLQCKHPQVARKDTGDLVMIE